MELIIDDSNYQQFINPIVDGERKLCSTIPRDYGANPHGSLMHAKPFNLSLIPRSEWQTRLDMVNAEKAQLSDIRNAVGIPSLDQNGVGYCTTEDTEILTSSGWVGWPSYNWQDPVGTVNTLTGMMEFQKPIQKHVYEYNGEIIYSTNSRIDFGVTPDHKMLVRKWDEAKRTLANEYTFQKAGELGWYFGLPSAPKGYVGTELVEVGIEGDRQYDGDDFIMLCSLIVSDGYAGGSEKTKNWVSFCCFKDSRYDACAALAQRVGFKENPSRKGVWIRYNAGALANWLRANIYDNPALKSQSKRIPAIIKCASQRQIKLFLHTFGDKNHKTEEAYYTASSGLADDLQELFMRIGKRAGISKRGPRTALTTGGDQVKEIRSGVSYTVTVSTTDQLSIDRKKHLAKDHYKGMVYCAGVPNGTLITRRNGSVLISSNCWAHSPVSAALLMRAKYGMPYVDLSAFSVGCPIKNYRDEGGWNYLAVERIASDGVASSQYWPQRSMSRSNDKPATWENARLHRFTDWLDLDPDQMVDQMVTCLLLGYPIAADFNWWGHSVCISDLVSINPLRVRVWNSWSDSWSEKGMGILEGNKAKPDAAIALRSLTSSVV